MDDQQLTRLFLFGQQAENLPGVRQTDTPQMTAMMQKFETAFGRSKTCPLYYGGSHGINAEGSNSEPGTILGPHKLPGARELAEGTNIYVGGLESACDKIIAGEAYPLDYRLFLGTTRFDFPNGLFEQCKAHKLQPLSCSRSA